MKRVIFMGTPDFAKTVLDGLIEDPTIKVVAVVTQPDRPVGRKRVLTPPPVKVLAEAHQIPVYQPEKISGSAEVEELIALNADLIITAAYGQFVPMRLLDAPPFGSINVHASLLPKYRGGAPIHYAIWQGESETGISIIYMTKQMDAGDIIAQRTTPIGPKDDVGILFERLAVIGRDLLLEQLPHLFAGTIQPWAQDPDLVTFSPTIPREQEVIDWSRSAQQVDWHVRAFRPFPSTHSWLNDKRVKIIDGEPATGDYPTGHTGEIVAVTKDALIIQCGDSSYYRLTDWQESGKKAMAIAQYLNGVDADALIGQQFSQPS